MAAKEHAQREREELAKRLAAASSMLSKTLASQGPQQNSHIQQFDFRQLFTPSNAPSALPQQQPQASYSQRVSGEQPQQQQQQQLQQNHQQQPTSNHVAQQSLHQAHNTPGFDALSAASFLPSMMSYPSSILPTPTNSLPSLSGAPPQPMFPFQSNHSMLPLNSAALFQPPPAGMDGLSNLAYLSNVGQTVFKDAAALQFAPQNQQTTAPAGSAFDNRASPLAALANHVNDSLPRKRKTEDDKEQAVGAPASFAGVSSAHATPGANQLAQHRQQLPTHVLPDRNHRAHSEESGELSDDADHATASAPKNRKMWTPEAYSSLIEAYRNTNDTTEVAARLGMPACTARTIINKYRKDPGYTGPKKRGGPFRVIYNREIVMRKLASWLAIPENMDATLREMIAYLDAELGKSPSKSTLATWLDSELVLLTKPPTMTMSGNLDLALQERADYALWHRSVTSIPEDFVYFGVHNISLWSKRTRAAAQLHLDPANTQAHCTISCLAALSPGLERFPITILPDNKIDQALPGFLHEIWSCWFLARGQKNSGAPMSAPLSAIFVCDRRSIPSENLELILQQFCAESGSRYRILAVNSSFLNPIEGVFEAHSSLIHTEHQKRATSSTSASSQPGMTSLSGTPIPAVASIAASSASSGKSDDRVALLQEITKQTWEQITREDLDKHVQTVNLLLPRCEAKQVVEVFTDLE